MDSIWLKTKELQSKMYLTQTHRLRLIDSLDSQKRSARSKDTAAERGNAEDVNPSDSNLCEDIDTNSTSNTFLRQPQPSIHETGHIKPDLLSSSDVDTSDPCSSTSGTEKEIDVPSTHPPILKNMMTTDHQLAASSQSPFPSMLPQPEFLRRAFLPAYQAQIPTRYLSQHRFLWQYQFPFPVQQQQQQHHDQQQEQGKELRLQPT